jgi:hypothetical protein
MRFFDLLRYHISRPAWVESPSIVPAQPSGIVVVRLTEEPPGGI